MIREITLPKPLEICQVRVLFTAVGICNEISIDDKLIFLKTIDGGKFPYAAEIDLILPEKFNIVVPDNSEIISFGIKNPLDKQEPKGFYICQL